MKKVFSLKQLKRSFIALFVFIFLLLSFSKVNAATTTGGASYDVTSNVESKALGYGVSFKQDIAVTNQTQKQVVSVLDVPAEAGIMVIPFTNMTNGRWAFTTVTKSIEIFERENPGYKVICAINGGAFDINSNYNFNKQCTGPFCYEGNYYRTTLGSGMWSGSYGFKNDGTSNKQLVSNSIDGQFKRTDHLVLAIYNESGEIEKELKIENLNVEPDVNSSSVYYGLFNDIHNYVPFTFNKIDGATSFLVDGDLVLPNTEKDFYGKGTVSNTNFSGEVLENKFVIVSKNQEVIDALKENTKVRVQYEAVGAFEDIDYVFGGGQIVLKDGEATANVNEAASDTHPRTAIGVKKDGSYVFVVVDGRNEGIGRTGVGGARLSAVMKNYGCVEAYNLDGGGSSTVVIRNGDNFEIKNVPSDGSPRSDGDCLLVAIREPSFNVNVTNATNRTITCSAEIIDDGGFDIDTISLFAASSSAIVKEGVATLSGLTQKTEYDLGVTINTKSGKSLNTFYTQKVHTDVTEHKLRELKMTELDDSYKFELDYLDRGKVTNLDNCILQVNGKDYNIIDGEVIVPKSEVGSFIFETILKYECDSFEGIVTKEVKNLHTHVIEAIDVIEKDYKDFIERMFG